ncbi:MAG: ABC transporter permease subunit [Patescibacteria group bacterium]|jgi:NitT/TauT family transport system permease protein
MANTQSLSRLKTMVIALSIGMFFLLSWQIFSLDLRTRFLFGSPMLTLQALYAHSVTGELPQSFLITGLEVVLGFVAGSLLGSILGFALWISSSATKIARPYLALLDAVPVFVFAPLIIIWFGVGLPMKIALVVIGTALVSLAYSYEGSTSMDKDEIQMLRVFGATKLQTLVKLIIPSSLSWLLASLRMNVGVAITGAVIGEYISSNYGLGHFMFRAGSFYDIPSIFAGAVYLLVLSFLMRNIVAWLEGHKRILLNLF